MNPLTKFIDAYQDNYTRFHMPGHKGRCAFLEPLGGKRDITEITHADDLYHSHGCIEAVEQGFSAYYKTESIISAGGSTLCIQTMLALLADREILAVRNAHSAFMNGCALCGIQPKWLPPIINPKTGLITPPTALQIENGLNKHPDVSVVYITSPDYYGQTANLREIAQLCRDRSVLLTVDNAHGAHLHTLSPSQHPIAQGAHLCCDSLHKTLPALTGAALLHAKKGTFSREQMKRKMALFGSTSPSYLIMESAGLTLDYLIQYAKADWQKLQKRRDKLIKTLEESGYKLLKTELSKLTIDANAIGRTGKELFSCLRTGHMEAEYADSRYVVLMLSPFNSEEELKKLQEFLLCLPKRETIKQRPITQISSPNIVLPLRDAVFHSSVSVLVEQAVGKISADNLFTCPPGIPILLAGEKVTPNIADMLKGTGIKRINVIK